MEEDKVMEVIEEITEVEEYEEVWVWIVEFLKIEKIK